MKGEVIIFHKNNVIVVEPRNDLKLSILISFILEDLLDCDRASCACVDGLNFWKMYLVNFSESANANNFSKFVVVFLYESLCTDWAILGFLLFLRLTVSSLSIVIF